MKKIALIALLGGMLAALFVGGFYVSEARHARQLASQPGMPEGAANSIKHSHAAARLYRVFRTLGGTASQAEQAVLWLGQLNEYAECALVGNDDTREMMKDLHNNYVGIVAAQWLEKHAPMVGIDAALSMLAVHKELLLSRAAVPLRYTAAEAAATADVAWAKRWFSKRRADIRHNVEDALAKHLSLPHQ